MKTSFALLVAFVVALPAGLSAQDSAKPKPKITRSPDIIRVDEIEQYAPTAQTAYDVVKQLRSLWLQRRGPSSMVLTAQGVLVYVNGVQRGGASALNEVRATQLLELQYLRPSDATQRYGPNHENGAILITLKP